VRQNVTDSAHSAVEQWFMGKSDELLPNRTLKTPKTILEKTPYRVYHKYVVDLLKSPSSNILSTNT
jgi:hypothetical protein